MNLADYLSIYFNMCAVLIVGVRAGERDIVLYMPVFGLCLSFCMCTVWLPFVSIYIYSDIYIFGSLLVLMKP